MPFLDIFSKKRIITKETPKKEIIVDYREKNSLVISQLMKLNFEIEFKELKVADYLIKDIAIERKTVSDFISSMLNQRLRKQLKELQQYPKKLLIIEGIDEQELYSGEIEHKTGLHPNSIRGFLLSILLKYNIPVIFTKNAEDTAIFMDLIERKKETEMSLNVSKKSLNKKERMQFILEGFPGIGPKTSKKLLKEFKSLKEIFNSPTEKIKGVIGKKADIFKLLDERY